MSVIILIIYWILNKRFMVIDCAPKIGHVFYDPLAYEAKSLRVSQDSPESSDSYLADDTVLNLRTKEDFIKEPRKICEGYDFDENRCIQVNGRLLCGYDKNVGKMKNEDKIVDLGNGCRQRGDRVECGYINGPFDIYPRRPPLQWEDKEDVKHKIRMRHVSSSSSAGDTKPSRNKLKGVMPEHKEFINRVISKATKDLATTLNQPKDVLYENTKSTHKNLEATQTSTIRIPTTTVTKTTKTTNSETNPVQTLPVKTESVTFKDKSTTTSERNFTRTNNIISFSTLCTTISRLRNDKTQITDVSTTSTSNTTLSTTAFEQTNTSDVSTYVHTLPNVEHVKELSRPYEKNTRKTDGINTNTGADSPVSIASNTTTKKSFKTVCVEKGDSLFCYDITA